MPAKSTILIVESDSSDSQFLQCVFDRILANCALHIVAGGVEARQFLLGKGAFSDRAALGPPSIILLALRRRRLAGFKVLEWIKSHPVHKLIPTIVYMPGDDADDIRRAYELGANAVMCNHLSFDGTLDAMKSMARFWLEECRQPPAQSKG